MNIIYAGATNHVTITRPKCGLVKNKDITDFKDTHKRLKAKCKSEKFIGSNCSFEDITAKKFALLVNILSMR